MVRAWRNTPLGADVAFRSPQNLYDIAGAFVAKNPNQIRKRVRPEQPTYPPPATLTTVPSNTAYVAVVAKYLARLDSAAEAGTVLAGRDGRVSVYSLGRGHDTDALGV